jgi:hypothetical protein
VPLQKPDILSLQKTDTLPEWWAKNQNRVEQAKAAGKLGKATVARVAREPASQTYLKMLPR